MAVEISDVMLLMGWAIAIWAIGVLSVIIVLYCCRGGSEGRVKTRPIRESVLTGQAYSNSTQAAPAQTDIYPPPESDDSYDGAARRRKQIPFETVYLSKTQKVFHTHVCSACKGGRIHDVEDMTKVETCKVCKRQFSR